MSEQKENSPSADPIEWRVTYVPHPGIIWQRYADAVTLPVLQDIYGVNWPPPESRLGERVYVVRNPNIYQRPFDPTDHPAAWISLTCDQFDPTNFYMSRGVWPDQHGQGLGRFLRCWAADHVLGHGGNSLTIWVNASNEEHLDKVMADEYWELSAIAKDPLSFMFVHVL